MSIIQLSRIALHLNSVFLATAALKFSVSIIKMATAIVEHGCALELDKFKYTIEHILLHFVWQRPTPP